MSFLDRFRKKEPELLANKRYLTDDQVFAAYISPFDLFESRDALIAANLEREKNDDFTKAVEDISVKETGQEL